MLLINTDKKMTKFIDDYGKNKVEEASTVKFTLEVDKRSDFDRLKKEMDSVQSARRLMPRNFVVALICCYDSFFGKILWYIFMVRPQILDSSERTLKYSDLLEFADISGAREYFIEKEVESVIRKSHVEHFAWLEKKLKISFNKNLHSWPDFVELTERRNLFVHTDGVISSQYLQVCKQHKCNIDPNIRKEASLGVSREYFENAYMCLYEIGFKLAHVIWRKLQKEEIAQIDLNLIKQSYDLIAGGDYEIAARILKFFTQSQMLHENDSNFRILMINLAQSYKWQKNESKIKEVLSRCDWSASEDRFRLAVMVLQDKWDEVYGIMRRLKHDDDFSKSYYKEWLLFKKLREEPDFLEVYKECYEETFRIEEEVSGWKRESADGKDATKSADSSAS